MAEVRKWQVTERVGGHPAANFVNTVRYWEPDLSKQDPAGPDHFDTLDDFIDWSVDIGLLSQTDAAHFRRADTAGKGKVLRQLRELRRHLLEILVALINGRAAPQASLDTLNEVLRRTAGWHQLVAGQHGHGIRWSWDFGDAPVSAILGPVAWQAADLLENGPLERLKQCPGEHCGWLFIDSSKNRSRNWCSMKTCGNAAKVKRFRGKR